MVSKISLSKGRLEDTTSEVSQKARPEDTEKEENQADSIKVVSK